MVEEREFREFQREVIDRLARIETRLEQIRNHKPSQSYSILADIIRVLVAAVLALAGVKAMGG